MRLPARVRPGRLWAEEACSLRGKRGGLEQKTLLDKKRTQRAMAVLLRMGEPGCRGAREGPRPYFVPQPVLLSQQTVHTDTVCETEGPRAAWRPFWEQKLLLHPGGWGVLIKRVPPCALHPGQRTSVCPPAPSPPCCAGPRAASGGGHSRCPWGTPAAGGKEMASLSSSLPVAPAPPARPLGCFSAGFFLGRPRASRTFLVFKRWGSLGWGAVLEKVRGASRKF